MTRTLLVVEDDDDIFEYYRILLGALPVRLLRAASGAEALAVLAAGEAVDLVLLDMVLPGMSGEELFRELRSGPARQVPVVACSVDESLIEPLRALGPLQGTFLKGGGGDLAALVRRQLGLQPAEGA